MTEPTSPPSDAVELTQRLTEILYAEAQPLSVGEDAHRLLVELLIATESQRNCIESLRDTVEDLRSRLTVLAGTQCDCGVHAG